MKLTLLTQTRNTGYRLEEWIRFHEMVGVDHFMIYLDNSEDNSVDILKSLSKYYNITFVELPGNGPYFEGLDNGRFGKEYKKWYAEHGTSLLNAPHLERQLNSLNAGMKFLKEKFASQRHWTAFLDVDEYLVPQKKDNLKDVIEPYSSYYRRIIAFDYRFRIPADPFKPIIPQTHIRRPVSNAIKDWPTRKSIIRTCFGMEMKCLHDMDMSPYLMIDDELKMYHYRVHETFSDDSYFVDDRRAIELLEKYGSTILHPTLKRAGLG